MAPRDYDRWEQLPDGSWRRRLPGQQQEVGASAAARELADEYGLDISTIVGTGKGGNVTKGDVEAAVGH